MPSTSLSELAAGADESGRHKKRILKITDLRLSFDLQFHGSWRDLFTGSAKNLNEILDVAKSVSLEIHEGERVGILGVNGAGKTSLCRCIAGLYRPTSGEIAVDGRVRAIFADVAGIHPELSGRENADLLASLLYPDEKNFDDIVDEAVEFSELGRFADLPFRLYSTGMKSRLILSVFSARPADLLILDEVFDGADMFFREKISTRILNLINQSGAVLFVSHSSSQITRVCNRALVYHRAQVAFDGTPEDAIRFYESLPAENRVQN